MPVGSPRKRLDDERRLMLTKRTLLLTGVGGVLAFALAGCAGGSMPGMDMGDSDTPAASEQSTAADFNGADLTFVQMMIPHHEQAVQMSDMLLAKDGIDPQVAELATQIKDAQQPEIDQLRDWLDQWGEDDADMGGMTHGGMMTEDDLAALEQATGADASKLFLEQMIAHHQGAIDMAKAEVEDGQFADAKTMAETIVATQSDEITRMQELLAGL